MNAVALMKPFVALIGLFVLASAVFDFLTGHKILTIAAKSSKICIVSDPISSADAAVMLGGGIETRPAAAAAYYKQRLVRKVLVSELTSSMESSVPSEVLLNKAVLLKLGVPEADIEVFGVGLSNTQEEAVALRNWTVHNHARMKRTMAGTDTIQVPALSAADYSAADWWTSSRGFAAFRNEVIKYLYYRVRYS